MASSRGRWASPERTMVWTEPKTKTTTRPPTRSNKVPVVYYLCRRSGHLEHPHFMEVALSSPAQGLYLRDVMDRLNMLRGNGMADTYSWSSKRSYKNGYVWHDLADDDLIHPAHGNEYVLKGSELLLPPRPRDASASSSSRDKTPPTTRAARRKNCSSFDLGEYKVAVRTAELFAATQTDDRRGKLEPTTELGIDDISPPPSSSSPETLETLIKNDARVAAAVAPQREVVDSSREVGVIAGGRMRASAMLMHLISCGSLTVKDGTAARYTERLSRGRLDLNAKQEQQVVDSRSSSAAVEGFSGRMAMDREYFSGSLIETNKTSGRDDHAGAGDLAALNADRGANKAMDGKVEEEVDGVRRARCIPAARKPRSTTARPASHGHGAASIGTSTLSTAVPVPVRACKP